jgi:dTDP-4-amino-4,6-dideoxygalactose transaminase
MIPCANPLSQFQSHRAEIEEAIQRVLQSGHYILGPELEALECEFAAYIGTSHAIGVANGTDALELSLRALGIGPGDEVITVSHTAVATVAAIEAAGAIPVLVDVEADFYTLAAEQLSEVLTRRTRAVLAVHLYGQAADMDAIVAFCRERKLALVEDVSQAHGARWRGKRLGSLGDIACFSCYPTKNLGAIGDAGLITTSDMGLAARVRTLREYGWRERYISEFAGRNSRLDELQAAILRVKLRHLDEDNAKRRVHAARYKEGLAGLGFHLPVARQGAEHVFHLYVMMSGERQRLIEYLKQHGIHAGIHYPVPVHLQPAYQNRLRAAASMNRTEALRNEIVSLPLYPELEADKLEKVIAALKSFARDDTVCSR